MKYYSIILQLLKENFRTLIVLSIILTSILFYFLIDNKFKAMNKKCSDIISEINDNINEDSEEIYDIIESKLKSLYFSNIIYDNNYSIEIYIENYDNLFFKYPIYFQNNSHIIASSKFSYIGSLNNFFLINDLNIILSSKKTIQFDGENFTFQLYESIFTPIFKDKNFLYIVLISFIFLFLLLTLFIYIFQEYSYLNKLNSCISLVRHEIEGLLYYIAKSKFPENIKIFLINRIRRVNVTLINFYDSKLTDNNSLLQIFRNIETFHYYSDHNDQKKYIY